MIALFGGTFDPIHRAHLAVAEEVLHCLGIDRVFLIPAGDPPHRPPPGASSAHRLAMLRLATAEHPRLVIDARETNRNGPSYSRLTLAEYRQDWGPNEPLVMVLGADAAQGLPRWNGAESLSRLCHLLVFARPGVDIDAEPLLRLGWRGVGAAEHLHEQSAGLFHFHRGPMLDISATALRHALARADEATLALWLPDGVLAYIREHGLYGLA